MSDSENQAGKGRAAAIRAEIDKITGATKSDKAEKPASPHEYIQKWMSEHDKKPDKRD